MDRKIGDIVDEGMIVHIDGDNALLLSNVGAKDITYHEAHINYLNHQFGTNVPEDVGNRIVNEIIAYNKKAKENGHSGSYKAVPVFETGETNTNDWRLPTLKELEIVYNKSKWVNEFIKLKKLPFERVSGRPLWSSERESSIYVYEMWMKNCSVYSLHQDNKICARAVKSILL